MSRSLAVRLVVTLALALSVIVALEISLRRPAAAAGRLAGQPPLVGGSVGAGADADEVPTVERFDWFVDAERVVLCGDLDQVPARAAPVVELLPNGAVRLRTPAPIAQGPGRPRTLVAAAILPVASLADLDPSGRAALLSVLGALWRERPVTVGRLVCRGIAATTAERQLLLDWLR